VLLSQLLPAVVFSTQHSFALVSVAGNHLQGYFILATHSSTYHVLKAFAVLLKYSDLPKLPLILTQTNLSAKQQGLQQVWSRMLWRQWLPLADRGRVRGPDAFETTMEVLRKRLAQADGQRGTRQVGARGTRGGRICDGSRDN